ncbi:Matrix metalloproteinase-14-like protein [Leptotrombidium deliense]|uniref:Matrix metalloproteinase-14-like protein n=1 Tax=Leptotrombidium deliense TaxID=299467 RepID=A0A443SS59_9ACAR|nr:Matrix metalloproteinase-14-like protein [Leptotrombidium deliense]
MEMMNKPRCGVPDLDPKKDAKDGKIRNKRYLLQGSSWNKTDLTWKVSIYSEVEELKGKGKEIDEVFKKSFDIWQKSSTLRFFHSPNEAKVDIEIKFVKGRHNDRSPFDGPGNTLAHAFYPEFGGDAHFDDQEDWTFDDTGTDLMSVAVHEFGHSLGLRHSDVSDAIMYPAYSGIRVSLSNDDIQGITMLYPKKPGRNEEEINRKKRPLTLNLTPDSKNCQKFKLDAATCLKEGYCFFFNGDKLWYIPDKSPSVSKKPIPLSNVFPGLTGPVDAAVTDVDGRTYIFKGSGVWIYNKAFAPPLAENRPIPERFPLNMKSMCINCPSKTDNIYWRYESSKQPPIEHGFPKTLDKWRGLPNHSYDAIFQWAQNRKTYFFKDDLYWRYNDEMLNGRKGRGRRY